MAYASSIIHLDYYLKFPKFFLHRKKLFNISFASIFILKNSISWFQNYFYFGFLLINLPAAEILFICSKF